MAIDHEISPKTSTGVRMPTSDMEETLVNLSIRNKYHLKAHKNILCAQRQISQYDAKHDTLHVNGEGGGD